MKRKWTWLFLILLLVGGGFWYWKRATAKPAYETTPVVRGDMAETVSVSTTLTTKDDIDLNFEIAGRVKRVFVREGQKVGEGDALALLDSASLEEALVKAKAALDKARADALLNDDAIREADVSSKDAKAYYEAVESAENQKVDAADTAYDNAVDYENDVQSYYDKEVTDHGSGSSEEKSAKLTLTAATNATKAAKEAKDTARENRDVAVRSAKNAWNAAKEKVKTAESSAENARETSAIAMAKADEAMALANLERGTLRAPVNGMVTKVNYDPGEVIGTSVVEPFGKLLSYDFLLEAKVPESDIAKVKLGQKADVTFDALSTNDVFSAEVIEIEPDSTVVQDVVYYMVKLRLADVDGRLKPGMSGDATIHIAEKQNVLQIPLRLLTEENGKRFANVLTPDGTLEKREVKTGLEGDEGLAEIVSGLSEGDLVVSSATK